MDLAGTGVPPDPRARCFAPISATDLLSRVSAGSRHSQARGLRPHDRHDRPRACGWVGAQPSARGHPRRRRIAIAGVSGPGSAGAVGAAPTSRCRAITPRGLRCPALGSRGRCRPASSSMTRLTDAPCRYPQPVLGIPSASARARTRFPASHQRVRLFEPEAPSTSKSHRRWRARAQPTTAWAAAGTPAWPPEAQCPTRFHAPPWSARPARRSAIRRGGRTTCRLPASAVDCPPNTPTTRPIPGVRRGKPLSAE